MPDATRSQPPRLLDEVGKVLRLRHYSIHTERSYVEWIIGFARFHGIGSRAGVFFPGEPKIESFVTGLAVNGNVALAHHGSRPDQGQGHHFQMKQLPARSGKGGKD